MYFTVETSAAKTGRENLIYRLTSSKKFVEGVGTARVYGVSCSFRSRPETEVTVEDVSANEAETKRVIFRLATLGVTPSGIFDEINGMLG